MNLRKTNYPIYLYVEKHEEKHELLFRGYLCEGREPNKKEKQVLIELFNKYGDNSAFNNFFNSVRNAQGNAFESLELLVEEAKKQYNKVGCDSGLILAWSNNSAPDKVLVYDNGKYDSESDFIEKAKENNYWVKYLGK